MPRNEVDLHLQVLERARSVEIEEQCRRELVETVIDPVVHRNVVDHQAVGSRERRCVPHDLGSVEAMLHGAAVVDQIELPAKVCRHGKIQIEHMGRLLVRIVIDALHRTEAKPPEQFILVNFAAIVGFDALHAESDRAPARARLAERRGDQLARAARDAHRSMLAVPGTVGHYAFRRCCSSQISRTTKVYASRCDP